MKIVGYCALWTIALALLVAMCAIIKAGYVGRPGAIGGSRRLPGDSETDAYAQAGHAAFIPGQRGPG